MRVIVRYTSEAAGSGSPRAGRRSVAGFSLLEVVIAAALLLLTVTAVTACVTVVSRSGQRHESVMAADRALASVASRLRSLPFCAAELPAPAAVCGPGATDLVSAVFPHANAWGGSVDGHFVEVGEDGLPAGAFVTSLGVEGVTVVCVARFRGPGGGWLGPDDLGGFDVTSAAEIPAAVLALDLRVTASSGSRSYRFECRAGASAGLDPGGDPA